MSFSHDDAIDVSIDASNEQQLKKIDRPLFADYWPRFLECLKELGRKVRLVLCAIMYDCVC